VINQELVRGMFGKIGYTPVIVGNGLEAIAALKNQPYDIVFLDVQMPLMNGIEAANYIVQRWPEISTQFSRPILIAMTASAMQGDREMCLEAGMDDYISKPIFFDTLQRMLESWGHLALSSDPQPMIATESTDFDHNAIREIEKISLSLPVRMINLFLQEEAPTLLETLHQAVFNQDPAQIEYAAHTLKGVTKILGAQAFSTICLEMERAGRHQKIDDIGSLLTKIDQTFPAVVRYLEAYLAEASP